MTFNASVVSSAVLVVCGTALLAQDGGPGGPGGPGGGFTVGVLGFSNDTPYGTTETLVLPMLEYENDHIKIGFPALEVKLPWISTDRLSFGLTVDFLGGVGGYKASDAPILAGMADRENGIWAGVRMDWTSEILDLSFAAASDVSGDSEGSRMAVTLSRGFMLGERFMVSPSLSAVWLDSHAADYYYGVRPDEATATRPAYAAESVVNLELGLMVGYHIDDRNMLMLNVNATQLGSEAADSPIVLEDIQTSIALGYVFRF